MHWNYQGLPAYGTLTTGAYAYPYQAGGSSCPSAGDQATLRCVIVQWPFMHSAHDRNRGGVRYQSWHGSLLEGKRDRSGLEYRRNRLYDPQTGRFTQEDPIGLAGGLNLYGFANGDPVNFSDPFGLCVPPVTPVCAAALLVAKGIALGVAVFGGTRIAYNAATGQPLDEGLQSDVARGALVGAGVGVGAAAMTAGAATTLAASDVSLIAPGGAKLAQMIARWGGEGGRDAFMKHAQSFATQAQRAGNAVTGTVGSLQNASVYRVGNNYMVVDAGGVIRSYVQNARPGEGIAKVFEQLAR